MLLFTIALNKPRIVTEGQASVTCHQGIPEPDSSNLLFSKIIYFYETLCNEISYNLGSVHYN